MKALRKLLVVLAATLPLVASAQDAKPAPITWYGILHTAAFFNGGTFAAQDAAYQGALTSTGGSFYASARQSRAGMKLNLGDDNILGAAVTGVLELDFMGGNSAATNNSSAYNPAVRLRHAAMTAAWKTGFGNVSLLVGQEWDFVNNLNPDSIAYMANPMFGQAGNLFRRVPQVRLSWNQAFGDFGLGVQAAVMNPADSNSTSLDNGLGNLSRSPALAGRAYLSMKGDIGGTVGVGYESEKRRFNAGVVATQKDVTTSLMGVDFDLAITKYLGVKGEYFADEGQADVLTGYAANTTVKTATILGAVKSTGYWAQAIIKPFPALWVTAGMGQAEIDKPSLDVANGATAILATDRTKNESTSVGLIVNASAAWKLGLDYYMTTSTYGGATTTKVDVQQVVLGSQLRF